MNNIVTRVRRGGRAKDPNKAKAINIRFHPKDYDMIEGMARRAGISFSEQVRCLVLAGIKGEELVKNIAMLWRLQRAAAQRENHDGDPSNLFVAKAVLRESAESVDALLRKVETQ
jgi:hypothetical protein